MAIPDAARGAAQQTTDAVREAAHEARPWVERLARLGYAAKGVVYVLVGGLALQAALGSGGKTTDPQGALRTILQQPAGAFLLGVVALGLAGYALWRFAQAFLDAENKGRDAKGIVKRVGYGLSGVAYTALAITAIGLIRGTRDRGASSGASTQDWTARFMEQPFGRLLVALAGVIVLAIAANALYVAATAKFMKKLGAAQMQPRERKAAEWVGRIGLAARGIVYGIIGGFLIYAALRSDPSEARGLTGAWKVLAQQPYGLWLLGMIAIGFVGYGVYCFFEARYRRVSLPA
jgi:hypothetical protein